jgi:hypothetical protein
LVCVCACPNAVVATVADKSSVKIDRRVNCDALIVFSR